MAAQSRHKPPVAPGERYGRFDIGPLTYPNDSPSLRRYQVTCRICGRSYEKVETSIQRDRDTPCTCEKTLRRRAWRERQRARGRPELPRKGGHEIGPGVYGRLTVTAVFWRDGERYCHCRCNECRREFDLPTRRLRGAARQACSCRQGDEQVLTGPCKSCGYHVGKPGFCMYLAATGALRDRGAAGRCLSWKPKDQLTQVERKRLNLPVKGRRTGRGG